MPKRLRSVWVTMKEIPMFGLNLAGYGSDRDGVIAEINAAEEMMSRHFGSPLRVDLDMAQTDMMPEIIRFLHKHSGQPGDPIFKLAIIGIPGWKKTWYHLTKKICWPKNARFFDEHEKAKAWLITERF
jgi:hypothetical protein